MYEALGIRRYQETEVASIGPEKLIVLLYEALLRHLGQIKERILASDPVVANHHLDSAQAIVNELRGALDHNVGGDIADNLAAIYDYVFQHNLSLLLDRDVNHVDDCIRVLSPLLDAWRQIPPGTAAQHIREASRNTADAEAMAERQGTAHTGIAGQGATSSAGPQGQALAGPDPRPEISGHPEPLAHSICVSA